MADGNGTLITDRDIRIAGKNYAAGEQVPIRYRTQIEKSTRPRDPAAGIVMVPPNYGRPVVPHIHTFSGMVSTLSKSYRNPDEAMRHSERNAHMMLLDPSLTGPLQARQRMVALLNWNIESEDDKNPKLKQVADELQKQISRTPYFTEYRRNLMEANWYGRCAIMNKYAWHVDRNRNRTITTYDWTPVSGDKLLFRYDDGTGKFDPNGVGIKVSPAHINRDMIAGNRNIEWHSEGSAVFFENWERERIVLHKHMRRDGEFEDPLSAGMVHGVGIRHFIYWIWYQKQETLAQMVEIIERTGMGFTIYYYPSGNSTAQAEAESIAAKQAHTNAITMPIDPAMPGMPTIEQIPANTAGLEALTNLVDRYFGDQILKFILGQTLSTRTDATGLGSGVAELHQDSLAQIVKYDAIGLEETLTREIVKRYVKWNFPKFQGYDFFFRIKTDSNIPQEEMAAIMQLWQMGAKLSTSEVMDKVGMSIPREDEETLFNPQIQQMIEQAEQQKQMAAQPLPPGGAMGPVPPQGGDLEEGGPPEGGDDDGTGPPPEGGEPLQESKDERTKRIFGPILNRKEMWEKLRYGMKQAIEESPDRYGLGQGTLFDAGDFGKVPKPRKPMLKSLQSQLSVTGNKWNVGDRQVIDGVTYELRKGPTGANRWHVMTPEEKKQPQKSLFGEQEEGTTRPIPLDGKAAAVWLSADEDGMDVFGNASHYDQNLKDISRRQMIAEDVAHSGVHAGYTMEKMVKDFTDNGVNEHDAKRIIYEAFNRAGVLVKNEPPSDPSPNIPGEVDEPEAKEPAKRKLDDYEQKMLEHSEQEYAAISGKMKEHPGLTSENYTQEMFDKIKERWKEGGDVQVNTMTRSTRFSPKHAESMRLQNGTLQMVQGKKWVAIAGQPLDSLARQLDMPHLTDVRRFEQGPPSEADFTQHDEETAEENRMAEKWQSFVAEKFGGNFGKAIDAQEEAGFSDEDTEKFIDSFDSPSPEDDSAQAGQPQETGKEPWMMTVDDWTDYEASVFGDTAKPPSEQQKGWHKGHVRDAISSGKPVPAEVLADYPDLAPKAGEKGDRFDEMESELKSIAEMQKRMKEESLKGKGVPATEDEKQKHKSGDSHLLPYERFVMAVRANEGRFDMNESAKNIHRSYVEEALKSGKPVPPEVLKDYPDLAGKESEKKEPHQMSREELIARFEPGNPFAQKAASARLKHSQLVKPTARDKAMSESFPLGVGYGGSSGKQIDASVNRATKVVEFSKLADMLEAKAEAFDAGLINGQGRMINAGTIARREKRENATPQDNNSTAKIGRNLRQNGTHTLEDGTVIEWGNEVADEDNPTAQVLFRTPSGETHMIDTGEFPGTQAAMKAAQQAAKDYLAGKSPGTKSDDIPAESAETKTAPVTKQKGMFGQDYDPEKYEPDAYEALTGEMHPSRKKAYQPKEKQKSMFDVGRNDAPGQELLFDTDAPPLYEPEKPKTTKPKVEMPIATSDMPNEDIRSEIKDLVKKTNVRIYEPKGGYDPERREQAPAAAAKIEQYEAAVSGRVKDKARLEELKQQLKHNERVKRNPTKNSKFGGQMGPIRYAADPWAGLADGFGAAPKPKKTATPSAGLPKAHGIDTSPNAAPKEGDTKPSSTGEGTLTFHNSRWHSEAEMKQLESGQAGKSSEQQAATGEPAKRHAPRGGFDIGGKQFDEGQAIPEDVWQQANDQERQNFHDAEPHQIKTSEEAPIGWQLEGSNGTKYTYQGENMWQRDDGYTAKTSDLARVIPPYDFGRLSNLIVKNVNQHFADTHAQAQQELRTAQPTLAPENRAPEQQAQAEGQPAHPQPFNPRKKLTDFEKSPEGRKMAEEAALRSNIVKTGKSFLDPNKLNSYPPGTKIGGFEKHVDPTSGLPVWNRGDEVRGSIEMALKMGQKEFEEGGGHEPPPADYKPPETAKHEARQQAAQQPKQDIIWPEDTRHPSQQKQQPAAQTQTQDSGFNEQESKAYVSDIASKFGAADVTSHASFVRVSAKGMGFKLDQSKPLPEQTHEAAKFLESKSQHIDELIEVGKALGYKPSVSSKLIQASSSAKHILNSAAKGGWQPPAEIGPIFEGLKNGDHQAINDFRDSLASAMQHSAQQPQQQGGMFQKLVDSMGGRDNFMQIAGVLAASLFAYYAVRRLSNQRR